MRKITSALLASALLCAGIEAATFDRNTGIYEGKITQIGCHASHIDNQCYIAPEWTSPVLSEKVPAGTTTTRCNSGIFRFWGKRAEGALMTSLLTDAYLAGKTVKVYASTACFDGFGNLAPTIDSIVIKNN